MLFVALNGPDEGGTSRPVWHNVREREGWITYLTYLKYAAIYFPALE